MKNETTRILHRQVPTKRAHLICCAALAAAWFPAVGLAQINTGSDGHDGAFNPTTNIVIDMADHPDGIYQYTSVNIPTNVTVTFIPNANNTPVVWLVHGDCVIDGTVDVSGQNGSQGSAPVGGQGGPGGFCGGSGGTQRFGGQGPGGGLASNGGNAGGGAACYGGVGSSDAGCNGTYGNTFLIPLLGGSGGGAGASTTGGGGGGGAMLIAAPNTIYLDGSINACGGNGGGYGSQSYSAGGGSGGGVRLVASRLTGVGQIVAYGGGNWWNGYIYDNFLGHGGDGRVRFDVYLNDFSGVIRGVFGQGFQPIIIPGRGLGQMPQLTIASVGGAPVAASPSGTVTTPDVIIPPQQANPIPIVVNCMNIPLNTTITVDVYPLSSAPVMATGTNTTGTQSASTATINVNMPRGGGLISATAVVSVSATNQTAGLWKGSKATSYAQTGLTTDGERFAKVEITAKLGGGQELAYITESGKRYRVDRN